MIFVYKDLEIYYEVIGAGNPVLILHGWGNDLETMRPIANLVKELGYKSLSMDLPGFGLSDLPKTSWEVSDYTNLIKIFLEEKGICNITLIAHSFGGRIAIKLAANYPATINKLILIDSAGIKPLRSTDYYLSNYFLKFVRSCTNLLPRRVKEFVNEHIIAKMGSADYRKAGRLRGTFIKVVNEDLRKFLPMIEATCLLVWGELDLETPVGDGKIMNDLISNSKLYIISGAGHHCFIDNFETFSAIITPFLLEEEYLDQNDSVSWL